MGRITKILGLAMILTAILVIVLTSAVFAAGPLGPAPNAGDGVSDGSGLIAPNEANDSMGSGSGPIGPAPNSGDGIPDGSGF